MTYSAEHFRIALCGNTLWFSGRIERVEYTELENFLTDVNRVMSPAHPCICELTGLTFLNSFGIRILANFLQQNPAPVEIRLNRNVAWQQLSIPMLTHVRPQQITVKV